MYMAMEWMDKSQWITPKAVKDLVETRRLRKEVEYNNGIISTTKLSAPDELKRREIIDDYQQYAANYIISLREVAFSALRHARMRDSLMWLGVHGEEESVDPQTAYKRIMNSLIRWQSNIIHRVCFDDIRPNDYLWLYKQRGNVQSAFDALGEAIELINGVDSHAN